MALLKCHSMPAAGKGDGEGGMTLRLPAAWLLVVWSILHAFVVAARAEVEVPRTIRIVMDNNYPPYVFQADDGKLQGILIDQWQAWEKKTGMKAEIHTMDWAEALARMRAGEFDVIDTIFINAERRGYLDFTAAYAQLEMPIFFRRELSGITGPESLKGFSVGAKQGDMAVELLKARGATDLVLFNSYAAIVEAAKLRKISAFVIDAPPALYYLNKLGIASEFRRSSPIYYGAFHRAVRKGDTATLRAVEDGFAAVGADELRQIDEKWFGRTLSGGRYFEYAGYVAVAVLLLIGGLVGWNRSLQRMVARRTAALRESEAKFRAVFDKSPIPILLATLPDGLITDGNSAAAMAIGYDLSEVQGKPTAEFGLWADSSERLRFLKRVQTLGSVTSFEGRMKRRNGEIITVLLNGTVVHIGGRDFVLSSVLDISERKRAEEQARRLANFPELNPNPVLEFSSDGALTYSNPAAQAMAGQPGFPDLPNLLPANIRTIVADCLRTGEPRLRLETRHGKHTLSWSFFPIAAERVVHCYVGEITERLQLEERIRQSQKMDAIGQLAGGIAHDFNNLLTAILGRAELASLDVQPSHPAADHLVAIREAALRSRELVKQILTFSRRADSARIPLHLQIAVEDSFRLMRSTIPAMVRIERFIDPMCPAVLGDAPQIHQVLMNLCTNAWHALPEQGGVIEIRLQPCLLRTVVEGAGMRLPPGSYVRLSVSDNGMGMDAATLERIYDPFFTTKAVGKGTGLGLSMVHGIVKAHDGAIFVRSEPGRGTTFDLYFPALRDEAPTPTAAATKVSGGGGERILYIDDDELVAEAIVQLLTRLGYRVEHRASPGQALELFKAAPDTFDLVITDLAMPEMSGTVLAAEVARVRPGLPVLMFTGYLDKAQEEVVRQAGVREVLRKPLSPGELGEVVRRTLG